MNKSKHFLALIYIIFILTAVLPASGAGGQLSLFPAVKLNQDGAAFDTFEVNATGTVRCSRIPLVFGAGLIFGKSDSTNSLGISAFADWWILDKQLINTWNLFSGFGAGGQLKFDFEGSGYLSAGPRFFIGTNWLFWDHYMEVYIQQNLVPTYCKKLTSSESDFRLYFPFEAGVRLHF